MSQCIKGIERAIIQLLSANEEISGDIELKRQFADDDEHNSATRRPKRLKPPSEGSPRQTLRNATSPTSNKAKLGEESPKQQVGTQHTSCTPKFWNLPLSPPCYGTSWARKVDRVTSGIDCTVQPILPSGQPQRNPNGEDIGSA
jgi:hypothetical protein